MIGGIRVEPVEVKLSTSDQYTSGHANLFVRIG